MTSRHNRRARHKRHKNRTRAHKYARKVTSALSDRLQDAEIDADSYRHKITALLARPALQGKVGATKATGTPPRRRIQYKPGFFFDEY